MIAEDEFHISVFCGYNFADALTPDRAVHHPHALHLFHQLVLIESGILRLQPPQPLGRAQLLRVDVGVEVLEPFDPLSHIGSDEGLDGFRAGRVDRPEQFSFDLVVHTYGGF